MILLNTHVLLWATEDNDRLGRRACESINAAESLVYSAITAWQIGMLILNHRINLTNTPSALLARAV